VIAEPPLDTGAAKLTVACALPAVAVPMVGAPGAMAGVTVFEIAEDTLMPAALCAATVHVTGVPFARPVTTRGEPGPSIVAAPQVAR